MVASSVPLLRPLFSAAKKATLTHIGSSSANTYELGSRGKGSQAFAYGNKSNKSTGLASSSEENILPVYGNKGEVAVKEMDVEQGVIKKEVQYQIKYETESGSSEKTPQASRWDIFSKGGAD
jgi:hypothetical protein